VGDAQHLHYSKRAMAQEVVGLLDALGVGDFFLCGHDRGGRVAHRLALDHAPRVKKLCVIDIAPTFDMYSGLWGKTPEVSGPVADPYLAFAQAYYHWFHLIQPAPLPERMIGGNAQAYLHAKLGGWGSAQGGMRLPHIEPQALADYERRPLLDKAMSGTYPPGSTFKMTTALAALAAGIDPEERIHCSGGWRFGGRTWRCWRHGGHGAQNMHDAIKNSCDTYFYHMCNRAGIDRIARVAGDLGFGNTYEIGIAGQSSGTVPSQKWKADYARRTGATHPDAGTWYPGETLSVAIGQGALSVSALQLAVMTARLANGRKAIQPRLVRSVGDEDRRSGAEVPNLPFSQEHLDYVRAGMISVANDTSGTAYRQSQLGLGDVLMAGKTGTAQVRSYDGVANRDSRSVRWGLKDHNLYVAFAPIDQPRYAISVIIQHGGLGGATAAAPRAREVMRVALLKDPEIRARIVTPMPMPDVTDLPPVGVAPEGAVTAPPPLEPGEPT